MRASPASPAVGAPLVRRIVVGTFAANCYLVAHPGGDAVLVDPGDDFGRIAAGVGELGVDVRAVLATHAHHDHVGAAAEAVGEYGAPFHMSPEDRGLLRRANFFRAALERGRPFVLPEVDVELTDGMPLRFGALDVAVVHTPGHTPGGVCFRVGGELFSGDTLLAGGPGRTDLPSADPVALAASLERLAALCDADTRLWPGHGESARLGDALARKRSPREDVG